MIYNKINLHCNEGVEGLLRNTPVVYKITFPNGQFYVGSTLNLKRRLKDHCANSLKNGVAHDMLSAFSEAKVDIIGKYNNKDDARSVEKWFIHFLYEKYKEKSNLFVVNKVLYKTI